MICVDYRFVCLSVQLQMNLEFETIQSVLMRWTPLSLPTWMMVSQQLLPLPWALSLSLSLSLFLSLSLTHFLSLSLSPSPLCCSFCIFVIIQTLLTHISEEECAPYYITSTAGECMISRSSITYSNTTHLMEAVWSTCISMCACFVHLPHR